MRRRLDRTIAMDDETEQRAVGRRTGGLRQEEQPATVRRTPSQRTEDCVGLAATPRAWMHKTRRRWTVYAATRYSWRIRASLPRTNRAADSKPRRFGAEQGMCVPMLRRGGESESTPTVETVESAWA